MTLASSQVSSLKASMATWMATRGDDEEVVAGEPGALGIEQVRADQQRQHQRAEQAGPALLDAEADELVERVRGAPLLGPGADAGLGLDEARQRRPDAARWRCLATGAHGSRERRGSGTVIHSSQCRVALGPGSSRICASPG